jgi:hypothetical protein
MPRITGVAPEFLVADVTKAAEHYRDKLGFRIVGYFFEDPPVFAMVGRDDQIIMLSLVEGSRGGSNRSHKREATDAVGRRHRCAVRRIPAERSRHCHATHPAHLRDEGDRGARPRWIHPVLRPERTVEFHLGLTIPTTNPTQMLTAARP